MTHRIVLASGNTHKLRELQTALAPTGVQVMALDDPPEVEETADTFEGNALLKALGWLEVSGLPSLADDSGLEVDALGGAPGVYSARYAGVSGPDADARNNDKLLQVMASRGDRTARFRCALVLCAPQNDPLAEVLSGPLPEGVTRVDAPEGVVAVCCTGAAEGVILHQGRGTGGFGYDPLFLSDDLGKTFAEAAAEEKAAISHRGRAVAHLLALLS